MTRKEAAGVMVQHVKVSLPAVISAIIITLGATRVYYGDRSALIADQTSKMEAMETRIIAAVSKEIAAVERRADAKIEASTAERWTSIDQSKWIALARQRGARGLPDVWEIKQSPPVGPAATILKD